MEDRNCFLRRFVPVFKLKMRSGNRNSGCVRQGQGFFFSLVCLLAKIYGSRFQVENEIVMLWVIGRLQFAWRSNQKRDEYHEETVPEWIKDQRLSPHARIHAVKPSMLRYLFIEPFRMDVMRNGNTVHNGFMMIPAEVKIQLQKKFGAELCKCLFGLSRRLK